MQQNRPRIQKMYLGSFGINAMNNKDPLVAAWWSCALPGFGHIYLGHFLKGFIFMSGEIVFNLLGHINLAIYHTFLGQFQISNKVLNSNWTTLYCAIFVYSIFDSYRVSVELNKVTWLESKQKIRNFKFMSISQFGVNAIDKRNPWVSAFWSMIFTGLGHLYSYRLIKGFLLLGWTVAISFYSKFTQLGIYTLTGQFGKISQLDINYQWLLFFPSIYMFGIYDAYKDTVNYNELYKEEQIYYLQKKYGKNPLFGD